ncbi:MAG: lysine 2,3-aminomutase [Ardenticatenaceae bacterium]|nr:lysine 2,3-aminomutase [Ardenticatenaceae bacterium]MCB9444656.1 lysine 2,3-aminomutase [Ardenticatenaceae bacterium]
MTKAQTAEPITETVYTRAPYWNDIPDEKWMDWRWQMSNRLNTADELAKVINLTDSERKALTSKGLFRVDITPYFASLMDPDDPNCPVRRQIIPTEKEMVPFESMMEDSLAEDKHSPVPGLVHRYPDRVLMLVTTQCASYCRYCTRSRIVGDPTQTFSRQEFDAQIEYIENTPQIRDVLLSGGDPMVLAPKLLEMILSRLRAIPHVEIIRIGSRVPVFLPMRVTQEFADMVGKYHPFWLNIHVNHPKEITPELAAAADRLTRAGVPLGNQSVLLAGVNDSVTIQRKLVHELVKIRVRPYYLYQCDLVEGAGHLRTSVSKGIEIMEGLRGHTSGYAVPQYVIDAPGGGGKIPVAPNYVLSQGPDKIILRNFEGFITTYTEPEDYDPHAIKAQESLIAPRSEPGQEGLTGLLSGKKMFIEPEGFGDVHARGGAEHRLRSGELKQKWQPLGVGSIEQPQLEEPKEE